jgi:hypothetical protein
LVAEIVSLCSEGISTLSAKEAAFLCLLDACPRDSDLVLILAEVAEIDPRKFIRTPAVPSTKPDAWVDPVI